MNLIFLAVLLLLFLAVWSIDEVIFKYRNKIVRLFVKFVRKEGEIIVRIENLGKLPIEIQAPELEFYNQKSSRIFAIKSPGGSIFPLTLFPLTHYEFRIDLNRFYDHDNSLRGYRKIKLIVKEKAGQVLKSKQVHMSRFLN